jgi:hypothetical protein
MEIHQIRSWKTVYKTKPVMPTPTMMMALYEAVFTFSFAETNFLLLFENA